MPRLLALFLLALSGPHAIFHIDLKLSLVVYVDEFKLAGPAKSIKQGWALLRKGLSIEAEHRVDEKGVTYLGCRLERGTIKLPNGRLATTMTYNMEDFLDSCVDKYVELAGPGTTVKPCPTPFLQDDHRESPAGAPGEGPGQDCPWCKHTFPPTKVWKDVG